jgi:hypothetical protein
MYCWLVWLANQLYILCKISRLKKIIFPFC